MRLTVLRTTYIFLVKTRSLVWLYTSRKLFSSVDSCTLRLERAKYEKPPYARGDLTSRLGSQKATIPLAHRTNEYNVLNARAFHSSGVILYFNQREKEYQRDIKQRAIQIVDFTNIF